MVKNAGQCFPQPETTNVLFVHYPKGTVAPQLEGFYRNKFDLTWLLPL